MLEMIARSSSFLCFVLISSLSAFQTIFDTSLANNNFQGLILSNNQFQKTSVLTNVSIIHPDATQTNLTDASGFDDDDIFKNVTWSPENAVPALFKNKKVPIFGVMPTEGSEKKKGVSGLSNNNQDNNPITKVIAQSPTMMVDVGRNDATMTGLITQVLLKQQELMNKIMENAAFGVSQMSETFKRTTNVKQNTITAVNNSNLSQFAIPITVHDLGEESDWEEMSESEDSDSNATISKFLAELQQQKPVKLTTNAPILKLESSDRINSAQPPRELLDSLLNLPPSLLDQAAKSVESGQITPEALASLLKLRPDLLGDAAGKIDTKQITPDVIRSLLKLRMTFMESGGSQQAFDQFARGSPDDLVKLMKVMRPAENSTSKSKSSKKKSTKNGKTKKGAKSETTSGLNLGFLSSLGDVTSETNEVKPTAEPAIFPNLLTLVRPHLFNLIGFNSTPAMEQGTKDGERSNHQRLRNQLNPNRIKSHRLGFWNSPKKCHRHPPRYSHYFPQHVPYPQHPRFRRPSRLNKNTILKAVSRGLERISNHFHKKVKFVNLRN